MRTTSEVIEAARMGEPCTEEELRLCIISMRSTMILAHMDHAEWASGDIKPLHVKLKSQGHWESVNTGWNIPLDRRVSPDDRPGNPDLYRRRDLANRVYNRATQTSVYGQSHPVIRDTSGESSAGSVTGSETGEN